MYWQIREDLKLTAGLRYTDDEKTFIPVPSQVLLAPSFMASGSVAIGYPERDPIIQKWGEWTGRLGFDWKPDVSFTDESTISVSAGGKPLELTFLAVGAERDWTAAGSARTLPTPKR